MISFNKLNCILLPQNLNLNEMNEKGKSELILSENQWNHF